MELALVDVTGPRRDDVHSIPESLLAQAGLVEVPGTPVVLDVKLFFRNAELTLREPGDPDPIASRGEGANIVVKPVVGQNSIRRLRDQGWLDRADGGLAGMLVSLIAATIVSASARFSRPAHPRRYGWTSPWNWLLHSEIEPPLTTDHDSQSVSH